MRRSLFGAQSGFSDQLGHSAHSRAELLERAEIASYRKRCLISADIAGTSLDVSDTNSVSLRAILAASPDVSVRTGLSLARSGNTKVNGLTVPGSNQMIGLVEVGTSVVLSRRTLLDVGIGAGLTQDSPDFVIGVSLPVRF